MIEVKMYAAIYGAALSTLLAIIGCGKWLYRYIKKQKELNKFQTDLYLLRKIDRNTKKTHPIVVVLLANLGTEQISLNSLHYSIVEANGSESKGCCGWYEQPGEAFGIRNRILPIILESGKTADLPIINIGVFTKTNNPKIWFTDFDYNKVFLSDTDIKSVKKDIEKYINETKSS